MTEKEKMLRGMLYLADDDPQLLSERMRAKDLCFALNQLPPSHREEREALLRKLLGGAGEQLDILSPFWCDYGCNITVGKRFFANHGLVILDCAKVTFGDYVFIAPNCGFYTAGHPLDAETRNAGLEFARPITVGDNVWFGGNVSVLPGVTIGSGSVIGAGSVVSRDIPPNVVAVGNPCRAVRTIRPEEP